MAKGPCERHPSVLLRVWVLSEPRHCRELCAQARSCFQTPGKLSPLPEGAKGR